MATHRKMPKHGSAAVAALGACFLAGCSPQMASRQASLQQQGPPPQLSIIPVQLEPCVDRTEGVPGRDLAKEATQALTASLLASKSIQIAADAQYKLTCDVECVFRRR